MKFNRIFSTVALICLLVVGISTRADAATYHTVHLTSSGPSPSVLNVNAGDGIGCTGVSNGSFYGGAVTSAPAGSKVTVGGNSQWLAGCLDFGFIADVAGTYSFEVAYDGGTYTGTVTAATGDTAYVVYSDGGSGPNSFNVTVGKVIVFEVGSLKNCADQVYLALTLVPYGASNPVPSGSGYDIGSTGHGPLTYPVTVEGTYSFSINGTSGYPQYAGSITATAAAAASVGEGVQHSGLSMTVNPAPSNGAATITFTSDKPCDLQLAFFDASGKQVHAYENVKLGSGDYSLPLSSTSLPSGDYYLRAISAGAIVATAKVLIVH